MTTRKQKHEAALARHEKRMAEVRRVGLEAQRIDRERREYKLRELQRPKHEKQHSWKKVDKDCLHCQDLLSAQKKQQREQEEQERLEAEEADRVRWQHVDAIMEDSNSG